MDLPLKNGELPVSFRELKGLRSEISQLCSSHLAAMGLFHLRAPLVPEKGKELDVKGFSSLPNPKPRAEISIGSTATCIRSLLSCPEFVHGARVKYDSLLNNLERRREKNKLTTTGLDHLNPFTVGQLLPTLKYIGVDAKSEVVIECKEEALKLIKNTGITIGNFPPNGYLTYWILSGLDLWGVDVQEKAKRCLDWSSNELYRQIGLFVAGDDDKSDAFQLGYNLLIQYKFRKGEIRNAIVEQGLKTLFSTQLARGVWEKKDPLFVYGNAGNAYCFSFELLSSVLNNFENNEKALMPYNANFVQAFRWIQRNSYFEQDVSCWRSGARVDDPRPESWATAEVYHFLQLYRRYLSQWLHQNALENLNCTVNKRRPDVKAFSKLYQPEIKLPNENNLTIQLDALLIDRLLEPLKLEDSSEYSLARHSSREDLVRSGIFFGPPGTGKTSYAKAIAKYLGWPLVVLDPSDFARKGFPLIPTMTTELFEFILELEDTVIFFDEMEVLMRIRQGEEAGGFEEKFLTTSLLPKLQELYSRARSIFLVATNYFETLDQAATREGRFDFKLQIMPPSFGQKKLMIKDSLGKDRAKKIALELDRHKEKLIFATRGEMIDQMKKLGAAPGTAAKTLDDFEPILLKKKADLLKEVSNNVFGAPR